MQSLGKIFASLLLLAFVNVTDASAAYPENYLPPAEWELRLEVILRSGDSINEYWGEPNRFVSFGPASIVPYEEHLIFAATFSGPGTDLSNDSGIFRLFGLDEPHIEFREREGDRLYCNDLAGRSMLLREIHRVAPNQIEVTVESEGDETFHRGIIFGYDGLVFEGQQIWGPDDPDLGDPVVWTCTDVLGASSNGGEFIAVRLAGPGIDNPEAIRIYSPHSLVFSINEPFAAEGISACWSGEFETISSTFESLATGAIFAGTTAEVGFERLYQLASDPYQIWDGELPTDLEPGSRLSNWRGLTGNNNHFWIGIATIEAPDGSTRDAVISGPGPGSEPEQLITVGDPSPWVSPDSAIASLGDPAVGKYGEDYHRTPPYHDVYGFPIAIPITVTGPGVTSSNDDVLAFVDRSGQIHVLVREGAPVAFADGTAGVVESFALGADCVSSESEVVFAVNTSDGRSRLVRGSFVEVPPRSSPPPPAEQFPIPELVLHGVDDNRTPLRRTNNRWVQVGGRVDGTDRIQWRRSPWARTQVEKVSDRWKIRLRVKTGLNRFAFRAISTNGQASPWQRIVIIRRSPR